MMREIGELLRRACAQVPGYGFALLIFEFGPDGNMFYTSNAQRADVIGMMREFIQKHEAN